MNGWLVFTVENVLVGNPYPEGHRMAVPVARVAAIIGETDGYLARVVLVECDYYEVRESLDELLRQTASQDAPRDDA